MFCNFLKKNFETIKLKAKTLSYLLIISTILAISSIFLSNAANAITHVHSISHQSNQGRERIIITSDKPIKVIRNFTLQNPSRLVLDIERINNDNLNLPNLNINAITRLIRFGHFDAATSRLVLELDNNKTLVERHISSQNIGKQSQLIIQLKSKAITHNRKSPQSGISSPPPPKHNYSKPTIVIDAGHGGKDPGAVGQSKTYEKNITLRYARHLHDHLSRLQKYNVIMTRSGDEFIFLHDRVKKARSANGDLFISIHADSTSDKIARGISIYTVSEQASDKEAEILASRENAVDSIGEIKFANDNPEVADILIDLASRDTRIKSTDFALMLTNKFKAKGLKTLKNPNRFAGFRVLKAPDIPSVLVEVGFISNPSDEKLLNDSWHMRQISLGIAEAIKQYFQNHPKK
jgi:N-acetylmuramoyl-L-alanine amidase